MKKINSIITLLFFLIPGVVFSGPAEDAEAKLHFEQFREVYSKSGVTTGELREALGLILKASNLNPDNYKYAYSTAATYDGLLEYANALTWFRKAVEFATTENQRLNAEIAASDSRFRLVTTRRQTEERPGHEITVSMMLKGLKYEPELRDGQILPTMFPVSVKPKDRSDYLESRFHDLEPWRNSSFIIFSYKSKRTAREHYDKGVSDFYNYFQKHLFDDTKHKPIILFLGDSPRKLIKLTNKLYPDLHFTSRHPFMGYYNKRDNVIFATVRGGYGTLLHEMTHALIRADYPDAPGWLEEAFATVYERTYWKKGRLVPLPNWRMDRLDLEDVAALDIYEKYKGDIKLNSSDLVKLRLLYLYLEELGQLKAFYKAVKSNGGRKSAAQIAKKLGVEQTAWNNFAENSIIDYKIDIAKGRGRSVNPAETRFIQRALNIVKSSGLKEDGFWGEATEIELKSFQASQGLKPDGVYGKRTRATLQQLFVSRTMQD